MTGWLRGVVGALHILAIVALAVVSTSYVVLCLWRGLDHPWKSFAFLGSASAFVLLFYGLYSWVTGEREWHYRLDMTSSPPYVQARGFICLDLHDWFGGSVEQIIAPSRSLAWRFVAYWYPLAPSLRWHAAEGATIEDARDLLSSALGLIFQTSPIRAIGATAARKAWRVLCQDPSPLPLEPCLLVYLLTQPEGHKSLFILRVGNPDNPDHLFSGTPESGLPRLTSVAFPPFDTGSEELDAFVTDVWNKVFEKGIATASGAPTPAYCDGKSVP